jgi:AbrB family looped-hinge helix DNA binding protein
MKQMGRLRVGKDGGFTIPKTARDALGLVGGDELELSVKDGELCISKVRSRTLSADQYVAAKNE